MLLLTYLLCSGEIKEVTLLLRKYTTCTRLIVIKQSPKNLSNHSLGCLER